MIVISAVVIALQIAVSVVTLVQKDHSESKLSLWLFGPLLFARLFSGLSRDVRSGSSPGSGWTNQGLVTKPLLHCLGLCNWGPCPVGR